MSVHFNNPHMNRVTLFEVGPLLLSSDFRLFLHSREVYFAKLNRIPGQVRCLKLCYVLTCVLAKVA